MGLILFGEKANPYQYFGYRIGGDFTHGYSKLETRLCSSNSDFLGEWDLDTYTERGFVAPSELLNWN